MSKRLLLLWISFALALPMRAQWGAEPVDTLDQARLMVLYELTYKPDSTDLSRIGKEKMLLLIGNKVSWFQSYNKYKVDNHLRKLAEEGMLGQFWSDPTAYNKLYQDNWVHFQFQVFKNFPQGKMTVIERALFTGTFEYEENDPCMAWEYTEDTTTVSGFFTQKAVCRYGGRDWEAWFAPELPYNDGPYKFCGLPGLIIKVVDTRDHYRFELVSVEMLAEAAPILKKQDDNIMRTTREKFFKINANARGNGAENVKDRIVSDGNSSDDYGVKMQNYLKSTSNLLELKCE